VARLTVLGFDTSHVRALPGEPAAHDLAMLYSGPDGPPWPYPTTPVLPGHVLAVAWQLRMTPEAVVARLRELGHQVYSPEAWPAPSRMVLVATSMNLNGKPPWLDPRTGVLAGHVAAAAKACLCHVDEVVAVLRALSFRVPDPEILTVPPDAHDWMVLSGKESSYLDPDQEVPVRHVARAATETGLPAAEVVRRMAALGFRVGDDSRYLEHYEPDDLLLLGRFRGSGLPWREGLGRLTAEHVIYAAVRLRRSPRSVALRCTELGVDAPDSSTFPATFDSDDTSFVGFVAGGLQRWLDRRQPVPAWHVISATAKTRRTADDVLGRLRDLGYDLSAAPERWSHEDELLFSEGLKGNGPWVAGERISAGQLVRIWLNGRDVATSARRLVELGMRLPEGIEIADQ
jgi:hypothetical protein